MKFLPSIQSIFVGLAFLVLVPSSAFSDQFALMDRVESGSGLEVTLGAIIVEQANGNIVLKNDYHLQLGLDELGVYVFIPTTHTAGDTNNSAIGNVEAGVVGNTTLGKLKFNYRFGVSVPTAAKSSFFEYSLDYNTNVYGASADPANFTACLPDYLIVRSSASPEFEWGPVFVRADIGTDILIETGDGPDDPVEIMVRINAAAGIDAAGVQVAIETANSFILTQSGVDPFSALGVTLALPTENVTVFGGVSATIGDGLIDSAPIVMIVNTGLRFSL